MQCSPFPLNYPNWTRGELLLASTVRTEISWGLSSITSLAITVPLFTILLPLPAGTTDGYHLQRLSTQLPLSTQLKSFALQRHVIKWGEDMFKISPCLSVALSGFPEEIKNCLTVGLLSCPHPCSYATVTVPTGHWHTWVLFKFIILQIEGSKREHSHEEQSSRKGKNRVMLPHLLGKSKGVAADFLPAFALKRTPISKSYFHKLKNLPVALKCGPTANQLFCQDEFQL